MLKSGTALALVACLGLTGLMALRLREERYTGKVYKIAGDQCWFLAEGHPWPLYFFPEHPKTLPARLVQFEVEGTKGDSDIAVGLRLPPDLRIHAVKDARVEIRHQYLDLPVAGPVAGRTRVSVGRAEWHDSPWPLWGTMAGIAALPLLLWLLFAVPLALLEKPASPGSPSSL